MQLSRLFEIVYILLGKKRVTAKELAERFEVSQRTIYRDVEALSMAGIPVYSVQGAGGGICIHEGFVLNKSALTDEEQAQILLALKSLSATEHAGAGSLLGKLGSLFARDEEEWVEIDFSRWGRKPHDKHVMATLKDAIIGRRKIAFDYYGANSGGTKRSVCPIKLVYKEHAWYLQAFDEGKQAYRTFKLFRMANIIAKDSIFDRNALPEAAMIDSSMSPPANIETVVLRFRSTAAFRVYDEFAPEMLSREPDGSLIARVQMEVDDMLYDYLFSLGPCVEVLSPAPLRQRMAEKIQETLSLYKNT